MNKSQIFICRLGAPCPKNFNLSEFLVSQVTVKNLYSLSGEDDKSRVQHIIDAFNQSEIFENLLVDIKNIKNETTVRYFNSIKITRAGILFKNKISNSPSTVIGIFFSNF